MRDLAGSRRRLLAAEGEDSLIPRLLDQRDRLQQEIAGLSDLTPRYARAVHEREQLASEIAALERESAELGRQVRLLETAVGLRDKWSRRALLDQQLSLANGAPHIPAGGAGATGLAHGRAAEAEAAGAEACAKSARRCASRPASCPRKGRWLVRRRGSRPSAISRSGSPGWSVGPRR